MSFREFLYKNRPTVLFFLFFILNLGFFATSKLTTSYLNNIRSFLIYFFWFSYKPIYQIIDYPLEVVDKFVTIPYLYEENIKLKEKLKKSFLENLYYKQFIEELNNTKKFNELKSLLTIDITNAKVIMREYKNWYNECIIYISEPQNVKKDAPVVIFSEDKKFYFVGRIWEIEKNIAKVLLITNPLSNIPVKVKNKQVYGVLVGNSSSELTMEYILLDEDIKIGDIIETVELNNLIGGIEIGRVVSVETLSTLGFKKAKVKVNFNINKLKEVIIITYL